MPGPRYILLLIRTFLTLEGIAGQVDPNFNIYEARTNGPLLDSVVSGRTLCYELPKLRRVAHRKMLPGVGCQQKPSGVLSATDPFDLRTAWRGVLRV